MLPLPLWLCCKKVFPSQVCIQPPVSDRKSSLRSRDLGYLTVVDRLPASRCCPPSFRGTCHTLASLVCDQQSRTQHNQASFDFRLQRTEPLFGPQKFKLDNLQEISSCLKKTLVGCKVGLERCIFSSSSARHRETLSDHESGGPILGVLGMPFWLKYHAIYVRAFYAVYGRFE